jgi:hypothetical protein
MSAEESMALARRFMEARINGDLDAVDGMLAADFINHNHYLPVAEQLIGLLRPLDVVFLNFLEEFHKLGVALSLSVLDVGAYRVASACSST